MGAKQTISRRVTVTRTRTPKSTSTSKSHAKSTNSGQKRCSKCGRFM